MTDPVGEYVVHAPAAALRPYLTECTGYRMVGFEPGTHAGLPSRSLTVILTLDEPLDLVGMPDPTQGPDRFDAMVGGLHAAPATIRHDGNQFGIQLGLTPLGARALLGLPPSALGSLVVPLEDLLPEATELMDRLRAEPDWAGRFAVVDEVLTRVVTEPRPVAPEVLHAWSVLCRTDGAVTVGTIAEEVGWSRRHLSGRFRDEYGLSPKVTAQVLRFESANDLLRAARRPSLADVAARCGYADQAHLTRDWRRFAGSSPTEWMASEEFMHAEAISDATDEVSARR